MARRMLEFSDRVEIATGLKAGLSIREIASSIGRAPSVVSREVRRHRNAGGRYVPVSADVAAQRARSRPKARKVDHDPVLRDRVLADLRHSRTPRQIAGRLRLEASDNNVEPVEGSPSAAGRVVSHEAIYQYIYALPKGELAKHGVMLRRGRTKRRPRSTAGARTARIIGMVSIDDRPGDVADRRVPGHWEGDLIIGKAGTSAAATLVERTTRFTTILALPEGKKSDALADVLIDHAATIPELLRKSLTWDQGTKMANHAAVTLAANLPVYFAHPHAPWERGTNENTNGLIREYLPKGTEIPAHQPYLNAIAEELNNRPRASLNFYTPKEAFTKLLLDNVATTT